MKKRVLFFACLGMLFSLGAQAQTAQLYRQTGDVTATATEFTYTTSSGGDKITYASASTSTSNVCAPSVRRIQVATFVLNYKTSSIGKIVISANSSGGTSSRTLTGLKINGADVFASVTVASSVNGNSGGGAGFSDCGDITITGLNVPADAVNGINVECTFDGNIRLNTISVWSIQALPLDLLSFSAKPDAMGKSVNLNWKTANEVNTQDFLVEKRTDDTEFTTVGTVLSKNIAGTHSYSFTDAKPVAGNSYYRLKQRDNDGKFSYSDVANVKIDGIALNLYPNPVIKELVVNHNNVKQPTSLKIVGLDGKTQIKVTAVAGSSSTTINVVSLTSGTYLLVVDMNGKPQSQKFIKK